MESIQNKRENKVTRQIRFPALTKLPICRRQTLIKTYIGCLFEGEQSRTGGLAGKAEA